MWYKQTTIHNKIDSFLLSITVSFQKKKGKEKKSTKVPKEPKGEKSTKTSVTAMNFQGTIKNIVITQQLSDCVNYTFHMNWQREDKRTIELRVIFWYAVPG